MLADAKMWGLLASEWEPGRRVTAEVPARPAVFATLAERATRSALKCPRKRANSKLLRWWTDGLRSTPDVGASWAQRGALFMAAPYPPEFRQKTVELVRNDERSICEIVA